MKNPDPISCENASDKRYILGRDQFQLNYDIPRGGLSILYQTISYWSVNL